MRNLRPPYQPPIDGVKLKKGGRASKNAPLVPIIAQGATGTCYSASALQLYEGLEPSISFDSKGRPLSVFQPAIGAKYGGGSLQEIEGIDGGSTCEVLNYLFENGACRARSQETNSRFARSTILRLVTSDFSHSDYPIDELAMAFNWANGLDPVIKYHTPKERIQAAARLILDSKSLIRFPALAELNLCKTKPELPISDKNLLALSKFLGNDPRALMDKVFGYANCVPERIKSRANYHCHEEELPESVRGLLNNSKVQPPRQKTDAPSPEVAAIRKARDDLFMKLNDILTARPDRAIGISYCANFYHNAVHTETILNCGSHASVLIDRRWSAMDNECQYLIRNSWGDDACDGYGEAVAECSQGAAWIGEATLRGNIVGYSETQEVRSGD